MSIQPSREVDTGNVIFKKDGSWLEAKWWYRFLKVLFIGVACISALGIIFGAYESRPRFSIWNLDLDKSTVSCKNGTNDTIYYKKLTFRQLNQYSEIRYDYDFEKISKACGYYLVRGLRPTELDERAVVEYVHEMEGSWSQVFRIFFIGFATLGLVAWGIRGIFNYIVCGSWKLSK